MKDFKDKVLVVTGAGSGLGKAIALEGAQRGMKLVLNDIMEDTLEQTMDEAKKLGAEGITMPADASTLENMQALFDTTMEKYGQVNMLVQGAGIAISAPIWEVPIQDITWITELNLLSHMYGLRLFIPQMIKQGEDAAVINIASAAGLMVSGSAALYHATKTGEIALCESTHIGLKEQGYGHIQVHAFCPAYIQTNLHHSESYRPERYQSMDDPYYKGQTFLSSQRRTTRSITTGMPIDSVGMTVFTAVEENKFYILTHPEVVVSTTHKFKNYAGWKNPETFTSFK